jgi:branched-chain amino acid transport system permease protein/neutral amino acid transport system permease protein
MAPAAGATFSAGILMFEIKQYLVSGILIGAIWMLPAIGISLIYAVLRIPHFAYAEFMTLGAYLALAYAAVTGLPFLVIAALAGVSCGLMAVFMDQAVFRPVRQSGVLPAMLLSLGSMLMLQNIVRFFWGNGVRQYRLPLQRPFDLFGFNITPNHLVIVGVSGGIVIGLYVLLKWTRFGREIRATANNPELARVTGVEPERVYSGLNAIAGILAGLGGVMLAVYTSLTPLIGWNSLLPLFAIALLGGLGRIGGTAAAALVIGLTSEYSLMFIQSSYKNAIAFVVLAGLLILRPRGLVAE